MNEKIQWHESDEEPTNPRRFPPEHIAWWIMFLLALISAMAEIIQLFKQ